MPATGLQQERRERLGILKLFLIECIEVVGLEILFDLTRFLLVAAGPGADVEGEIEEPRVERRELKIGLSLSRRQVRLLCGPSRLGQTRHGVVSQPSRRVRPRCE